MNDVQKLAHNVLEALKPLDDALNQIVGAAQTPPTIETPGLIKNVNIKGMAARAEIVDPAIHLPGILEMQGDLSHDNLKLTGHLDLRVNTETTLGQLRPGAVFVTRENVYAVKSEYLNGDLLQCECVLLESGEYAWFKDGDQTIVKEVQVEGFTPDERT